VVALFTLEAEYIASSHAIRESLWFWRILEEIAATMSISISKGPVPIGCDNQGAIKLITSGVVKQKSKHIDVKYHHVHDEQTKGLVHFQYVTSAANPAALLTKPLAAPRHAQLLQLIHLSPNNLPHPINHNENISPNASHQEGGEQLGEGKGGEILGRKRGVRLREEGGGARKKA